MNQGNRKRCDLVNLMDQKIHPLTGFSKGENQYRSKSRAINFESKSSIFTWIFV